MKRVLLIFLVFASLLIQSVCAQSIKTDEPSSSDSTQSVINTQNISYKNSPINKLGRGIVNSLTCWAEMPVQMCKVSKERDPLVGFTVGLWGGIFQGFLRGIGGLFDMATFIIPPYNKPLVQPEYIFDTAIDTFRE